MHTSSLVQLATNLVEHLGYSGLGLGLLLNTIGLLIPSEILIPLAGVAVRQGKMNAVAVVVVAVAAQTVGSLIGREIGLRGGIPLIRRFGRYVLLSEHDLAVTHKWFSRHGRGATVLAFCLPVVRGYIGFAAGIGAMPRLQLAISAIIGTTIWTVGLLGLGFLVADNLSVIESIMRPFSAIIVILFVAIIGWFIYRRLQERKA